MLAHLPCLFHLSFFLSPLFYPSHFFLSSLLHLHCSLSSSFSLCFWLPVNNVTSLISFPHHYLLSSLSPSVYFCFMVTKLVITQFLHSFTLLILMKCPWAQENVLQLQRSLSTANRTRHGNWRERHYSVPGTVLWLSLCSAPSVSVARIHIKKAHVMMKHPQKRIHSVQKN